MSEAIRSRGYPIRGPVRIATTERSACRHFHPFTETDGSRITEEAHQAPRVALLPLSKTSGIDAGSRGKELVQAA
jgi:hypothetical protein